MPLRAMGRWVMDCLGAHDEAPDQEEASCEMCTADGSSVQWLVIAVLVGVNLYLMHRLSLDKALQRLDRKPESREKDEVANDD
jgi:hypothetical protein